MFDIEIIPASIRIATPLTLAALGGVFSERGGVVNIALEGIMLNSAYTCAWVTYTTGNPWLGVMGAIVAGLLTALLHSIVTITFKADQIVSGVAINLLAAGLTPFLCSLHFGMTGNTPDIATPSVWKIPFIGSYSPIIYITVFAVLISHFVLYRTVFGLRLISVGEHPLTADTLGINVDYVRYCGVLISGILAGMGGAFLSFEAGCFVKNISAGRGYIALAGMIFGRWTPIGAMGACLLFGFAEAIGMRLQSQHIPTQFVQMIPYLVTIVVLAGVGRKAIPPASDGIPYRRSEVG